MKQLLRPAIVVLFVLLSSLLSAATPPNILLFMADDLSFHDLGCAGNPDVRTPNLDRFAQEGTRYRRAYTSSPMCAPTRMSLYTGLHPVRNGGYPNHSAVHPGIRSLPHYLGDLGYTVALNGKRHEKPDTQFPFVRLGGRDEDNGDRPDLEIAHVRRFLADQRDRPWCLVVTSNQPHTPWNRGDASTFDPDTLTVPPYLVDTPGIRRALANYYAEIEYMDAQFGAVMAELAARDDSANTLVVFLTEQGSGFPFAKWTCYEPGLRATALVRWPGIVAAGVVSDQFMQYVDFVPTFIEVAGGNPAEFDFDGRSLLPVLRDSSAASPHRHVFGLQTTRGIFRGAEAYAIRTVRDDRYRLIWNLHPTETFANTVTHGFRPYLSWRDIPADGSERARFAAERYAAYHTRPEFELYDLESDPWALNNLANQPELADRRTELFTVLKEWMKEQGDEGDATERAALERMPGRRQQN